MHFDVGGALLTDQAPPGCYGDSMANTSRFVVLGLMCENHDPGWMYKINQFRRPDGYIRHPLSPWGTEDTSGDQKFPFMMAASLSSKIMFEESQERCRFANTGCFALSFRWCGNRFLLGLILVAQALLFKIPIRWSDDNRHKRFVWIENSDSGDYLNYITALCYLWLHSYSWPIKVCGWLTPPEKIFSKIVHYHLPEPNSDWIVDLYSVAIVRCFGGPKHTAPQIAT